MAVATFTIGADASWGIAWTALHETVWPGSRIAMSQMCPSSSSSTDTSDRSTSPVFVTSYLYRIESPGAPPVGCAIFRIVMAAGGGGGGGGTAAGATTVESSLSEVVLAGSPSWWTFTVTVSTTSG